MLQGFKLDLLVHHVIGSWAASIPFFQASGFPVASSSECRLISVWIALGCGQPRFVQYVTYYMPAETSTICLNALWFFKLYPVSARVKRAVELLFVALFTVTRIINFPYMQVRNRRCAASPPLHRALTSLHALCMPIRTAAFVDRKFA